MEKAFRNFQEDKQTILHLLKKGDTLTTKDAGDFMLAGLTVISGYVISFLQHIQDERLKEQGVATYYKRFMVIVSGAMAMDPFPPTEKFKIVLDKNKYFPSRDFLTSSLKQESISDKEFDSFINTFLFLFAEIVKLYLKDMNDGAKLTLTESMGRTFIIVACHNLNLKGLDDCVDRIDRLAFSRIGEQFGTA